MTPCDPCRMPGECAEYGFCAEKGSARPAVSCSVHSMLGDGEFLPGDPWPAQQAPEPAGQFSPNMHTQAAMQAVQDAYFAKLYKYGQEIEREGGPLDIRKPQPDAIKRPAHYARYAIEPITFIMANDLNFCVGNVVKYILRYDAKNGREDVRKAIRYCEMLLEDMDRKAAGTVADCVNNPL